MPINEAARLARNEYARKWRAEHKDKVKQYNRAYWERKATQTEQMEEIDAKDKI